jgi:hypothetical protein
VLRVCASSWCDLLLLLLLTTWTSHMHACVHTVSVKEVKSDTFGRAFCCCCCCLPASFPTPLLRLLQLGFFFVIVFVE